MQSMQRQFGKLTHKGPGNEAKIAVLLQDYENGDKMLSQIIEASKAWRDAWVGILTTQSAAVISFEELYSPIVGATSDGYGHEPALTPRAQLDRTVALKDTFAELKTDLMDEVLIMDARIIKPATEAKEFIQPVKKTIKKREKKRVDYDRSQDKVTSATRKAKRNEVEIAKAEAEMSKAADDFHVADAHLRETLPALVEATFSLLPHLLAAQIMTQNTLLAQYYTVLHNYCTDQGLPSPPPPMVDVIAQWENAFKSAQRDVESITLIARGKAVHQPMQQGDPPAARGSTLTGMNLRNGFAARRASSQPIVPQTSIAARPDARAMRIPSSSSIPSNTLTKHDEDSDSESERPAFPGPRPTHLTPGSSTYLSHSPAGPTRDSYASNPSRRPSNSSTTSSTALAVSIAGKKKPPPPPPKRLPSATGQFVVAIYSFAGEEHGDLSFTEGDRIRVLKKTDSKDDWWDGEVRGVKGRFPANYCE